MKINNKIKELGYCRTCLNRVYNLQLKRKDVFVYEFPSQCRCCHETKNTVYKVRPKKSWKLLFARKLRKEV